MESLIIRKIIKRKNIKFRIYKKKNKMEHIYTINDKKFKYTNLKKELIL